MFRLRTDCNLLMIARAFRLGAVYTMSDTGPLANNIITELFFRGCGFSARYSRRTRQSRQRDAEMKGWLGSATDV